MNEVTSVRITASAIALLVIATCGTARADLVAAWTFETSVPATAGPHAAEGGVNAATSFASGFHSNAAAVYSNPAGNGSAESFSSNTWTAGDYYQFTTSTLNYHTITFGWDQTRSSTGPDSFKVEANFGSGFVNILSPYTVGTLTWSSGTPQPGSVFAPISLGTAAAGQPSITVRLTSLVGGAAAGTNRIDNVMISGTAVPEPGAVFFGVLVCGVIGVGFVGRKLFASCRTDAI
jgi:hypothetical protein